VSKAKSTHHLFGDFDQTLGVIFITLKLCGVISWSWLWVLAPFWLLPAIILAVVFIVILIAVFFALIAYATK